MFCQMDIIKLLPKCTCLYPWISVALSLANQLHLQKVGINRGTQNPVKVLRISKLFGTQT